MSTKPYIPPSDYQDEIGAMLLSLSITGETNGFTWAELGLLVACRWDDLIWFAVGFAGAAMDQMGEGMQ